MRAITTSSSPLFQTHHMSAQVALVILVTSLKLFFICFHLSSDFSKKLSGLPMCAIVCYTDEPMHPLHFFYFYIYYNFPLIISMPNFLTICFLSKACPLPFFINFLQNKILINPSEFFHISQISLNFNLFQKFLLSHPFTFLKINIPI